MRNLVFLHGWGMDSSCWAGLLERLSGNFRTHCADLPGHGRNPHAKDWVETLSGAHPFEVDLVGWSLGGQVALEWAARFPEQVRSLVLVATTPSFVKRQDWDAAMQEGVFMEFLGNFQENRPETMKRFLHLQALGGNSRVFRMLQKIAPQQLNPEGLEHGLDLLGRYDLREAAKGLAQEALVLHGTCDSLIPFAAGKWLCANMKNARLVGIEGAAHAPHVSDPQVCANALQEFYDGR